MTSCAQRTAHEQMRSACRRAAELLALCSMRFVSTRLLERPELAGQPVCGEHGHRLVRRCRLPIQIHPSRVPVAPEFIDHLRRDDRAEPTPRLIKPGTRVSFRPEGRYVGSSEDDVIPEVPSGHEKMHDCIAFDSSVADREGHCLTGGRRVRLERAVAEQSKDGQSVPHAVREPGVIAYGDDRSPTGCLRRDAPSSRDRCLPRTSACSSARQWSAEDTRD